MDLQEIKYQGRSATAEDIDFIKGLIANNPQASRRTLSKKLCNAWKWLQPNGTLQDMICRGFLLKLESAGYIELPPKRCTPNNPLANRKTPPKVDIDQTPLFTTLSEAKPLEIRQVRFTCFEKLFNSLVAHHHYLGYVHPIGEHLKYIVFSKARPIACFSWASSPRHIGCRDRFIGWSADVRKKNLYLIACNSRFLIFNWVRIPNLASHLLATMTKVVPADWQEVYHHGLYFLETFVDTSHFKGSCYQAAGWVRLGVTTGRGKNDQTHKVNRSIKAVWGYPVSADFRQVLQHG